jgi:hypothetical protein
MLLTGLESHLYPHGTDCVYMHHTRIFLDQIKRIFYIEVFDNGPDMQNMLETIHKQLGSPNLCMHSWSKKYGEGGSFHKS